LLAPLGPVTARAMFGGHGLYLDGIIFALIAWDRLYFRTDAQTKERFRKAGGEVFAYEARGRTVDLPYSTAPPPGDTTASVMPWAELAVAAAKRVAKAKRSKRG
jgi:DNA transformation protein